jgi:hypothetical protein
VIIKSREMGKGLAGRAIAEEVGSYLDIPTSIARSRYHVPKAAKPEGFTSIAFDHVNIKAATKQSLKHVNVPAMLKGIRTILQDGLKGQGKHEWNGYTRWFASSEATGSMVDNASRYITWLHEMGHQVHYKAGTPSPPTTDFITEYGSISNEREWFAEHFVFWLLGREQLAEAWPETALWFDNIMQGLTE